MKSFLKIDQFFLLINVQIQHRIFRLQLQICQIHIVVMIKPWVLHSISSYKHDNLLYGNSVRTLWVRLLAILHLSRNSCLTCLFFNLLARFEVYDICICFWMFECSNFNVNVVMPQFVIIALICYNGCPNL